MTNDMDTPTAEFRDHLEAEITRAYRREMRLGTRREPRQHRWRASGLLAACLALGAVSGIVSAQARDFIRRDSILEAARAEAAIAAMRLEFARAELADASRKQAIGVLDSDAVAYAELRRRSIETLAARLQLNIEEIEASSLAPRNELTAPLVGGRDFVAERIRLDLADAERQNQDAQRALASVERKVSIGAVSELARAEAELEVTRSNGALAVVAQRLSLRREFNEKGTSADELARRLQTVQLQQDVRAAQQALKLARARLMNVERQRAVGAATELDLMRAKTELLERELSLQQLASQLRRIGGGAER